MKRFKRSLVPSLAATVALEVFATPVTWTIESEFPSGDTVRGTFVYDADFKTYSNIDVVYTASGAPYELYSCSRSCGPDRFLFASDLSEGSYAVDFFIPTSLTNAGGVIEAEIGGYAGKCGDAECLSLVVKNENFNKPFKVFAPTSTDQSDYKTPPYRSSLFVDPNWMSQNDHSIYISSAYIGKSTFTWFDFRSYQWNQDVEAYSYRMSFRNGIEVMVSISTELPRAEVPKYLDQWGFLFGQAPPALLSRLGEFQIVPQSETERGLKGNGSTNPNHVVLYADDPEASLAEALVRGWVQEGITHEMGHALFPRERDDDWLAAQEADNCFISEYAEENPFREDIAESLAPFLMTTYRRSKVLAEDLTKIEECIPNRMRVLANWFRSEKISVADWAVSNSWHKFFGLFSQVREVLRSDGPIVKSAAATNCPRRPVRDSRDRVVQKASRGC